MAGPESGDNTNERPAEAAAPASFDASALQTPSTEALTTPGERGLDKQIASVSDLSSFPTTNMWQGKDNKEVEASAAQLNKQMGGFNQSALIRRA